MATKHWRDEKCMLAGCTRQRGLKKAALCVTCYNRLYNQLRKGPTWMMERLQQVGIWEDGLRALIGEVPKRQAGHAQRVREHVLRRNPRNGNK